MSHTDNKVRWCLKKAGKEMREGDAHRGLRKIQPDKKLADMHIKKAEHNLKAISDFRSMGYSDWSASAAFYAVYHAFLAVFAKQGYESRNQKCTFALIFHMIDNDILKMEPELVSKIHEINHEEQHESPTMLEIREARQYGTSLSIEDNEFEQLLNTAKAVIEQAKEAVEI